MIGYCVPLICMYDAIVPDVAVSIVFEIACVEMPSCAAFARSTLMSSSGCDAEMPTLRRLNTGNARKRQGRRCIARGCRACACRGRRSARRARLGRARSCSARCRPCARYVRTSRNLASSLRRPIAHVRCRGVVAAVLRLELDGKIALIGDLRAVADVAFLPDLTSRRRARADPSASPVRCRRDVALVILTAVPVGICRLKRTKTELDAGKISVATAPSLAAAIVDDQQAGGDRDDEAGARDRALEHAAIPAARNGRRRGRIRVRKRA